MYEKEFEAAKAAALKAGKYLREHKDAHIDSEEGKDIKLSSDKGSEHIIMEVLDAFGYSILSEEYGLKDKGTDYVWIIDPLDGTMNYSRGLDDLACVSVALWKDEEPILGVVYRFKVDEMFCGLSGKGAWLNDNAIRTSGTIKTSDAVLASGFSVKRSYDDKSLTSFVQKVQRFKKIRMLGAAAIMGAFVACGRVDAYMEEDIMLWDVAGAAAIVKAAGGCVRIDKREDFKCLCCLYATDSLMKDFVNA